MPNQNEYPYYPYLYVSREDAVDSEGQPIIPRKKHKGGSAVEMLISAERAAMVLREESPDKEVYIVAHPGNMYLRDYTTKPPSFVPVPENCPRTIITIRANGDIDRNEEELDALFSKMREV